MRRQGNGCVAELKFGLSGCAGGFDSSDPEELLTMSEVADTLGYTGIWINEEHFQQVERPRRCFSPLILGTAIAARTTNIRIGFSVLLMSLHNPVRLAEDITSMDVLSKGRVDFGISRGNSARYLAAYGIDPGQASVERFHESLKFLMKCWEGTELGEGEQKFSTGKTVQQPHPPIYIGTYDEETASWAGREGHLLIQHGIQSKSRLKAIMRAFENGGGDVSKVPVGRFMYVGKSDSSAREVAWPAACQMAELLRKMGMHKKGVIEERDLDPERFYNEMVIAGGPDSCIKQLRALSESLGTKYVNSLPSFFGHLSPSKILPSLEIISKYIMPILGDSK